MPIDTAPVLRLERFKFDRESRSLVAEASELGLPPGPFPERVTVWSHHTGRTVEWFYDHAAAERNEWWDGMEAHYRTSAPRCSADTLIIIND